MATRQHVPERIEEMSPGPALCRVLSAIDLSRLAGHDLVAVLRAWDRQVAYTQAQWLDAMVEVGTVVPGPDEEPRRTGTLQDGAEHEVRAGLVLSRPVAASRQAEGAALRWRHPALRTALVEGDIDLVRAQTCLREVAEAGPEQASAAIDAVLPEARSLTPGELAARLREYLCAVDPEASSRRHEAAVAARRMRGYHNRDGTIDLCAENLPPERAAAMSARIDAIVAAARRAGHPGMLRVLRVDVCSGLLDGRWEQWSDAEIVEHLLAEADAGEEAAPTAPEPAPEPEASEPPPHGEGHRGDAPGDGEPRDDDAGDDPGDDDPGGSPPPDPPPPGPRTGPAGGTAPGRRWRSRARPHIEVRAALTTLLGRDEHPGELAVTGMGTQPVAAVQARGLVQHYRSATWRIVLTGPDGHLRAAGVTRARPHRSSAPPAQASHGGGREATRAVVEVRVGADDLDRLDDDADPRWGPMIAAARLLARERAPDAPDPRDGDADDRCDGHGRDPRRSPEATLENLIRARDRTCVFPGCPAPAHACEIDHSHEWARRGRTAWSNLGAMCPGDHRVKGPGGWEVRQIRPGTFTWSAPGSGIAYARPRRPLERSYPSPRPRGRVPVPPREPADDTVDGTPTGLPFPIIAPPRAPPHRPPTLAEERAAQTRTSLAAWRERHGLERAEDTAGGVGGDTGGTPPF